MNNILKALSSIPILRNLSPEQLDKFKQITIEKIFNKNKLIFQDGDKSDGIYMIVEGTVKVFKLSHNGKEHILFYFSVGQIFGEISIFDGCHFANAEAIETTRVLFIHRFCVLELLKNCPEFAMKMLADLSNKIGLLAFQIENLKLKQIPSRLAAYLLSASEKQTRRTHVNLNISKGDLASLIGSIPETLSRAFSKLSAQGIIRVEGQKITLLDKSRLRNLSETRKNKSQLYIG